MAREPAPAVGTLDWMVTEIKGILGRGYLVRALYGPGLTDVTVTVKPSRWRRIRGTIAEGDFEEPWRETVAAKLREEIEPQLDAAADKPEERVWMLLRWE